jgi:Fe-S-cluster containining protein
VEWEIIGGINLIHPKKLKKAFEKVEEENWMLRAFLKNLDDVDELDRLVHSMHEELFNGYDCVACRNCCKAIVPAIEEGDIKKIADYLEISIEDFKSRYLKEIDEGYIIKDKPCVFLAEKGCSIYDYRPENCREYPYTLREEIWSRLINLVKNCAICPVVFEIFERLKKYYGYEFKKYKKEYKRIWG